MEALGRYIVSICSAAIVCGILKSILPQKGMNTAILRLASGIFLSLAVIRPLSEIDLQTLPMIPESYLEEAREAGSQGVFLSQNAMADIIKSRTEAYILDKAQSLRADLTVEVTLSPADPPVPVSVRLSGSIAPYARQRLEIMLEEELGIAKENQQWNG